MQPGPSLKWILSSIKLFLKKKFISVLLINKLIQWLLSLYSLFVVVFDHVTSWYDPEPSIVLKASVVIYHTIELVNISHFIFLKIQKDISRFHMKLQCMFIDVRDNWAFNNFVNIFWFEVCNINLLLWI